VLYIIDVHCSQGNENADLCCHLRRERELGPWWRKVEKERKYI